MHGKGEHATLCSNQLDHIIMRSHSHLDDEKSEKSNSCLMALDLLLHDLVLHHIMQFQNFYLVFLSVSQCQGIAPCYTTLELIDFLEISVT